MSLINQVLVDLDRRREADPVRSQVSFAGVSRVAASVRDFQPLRIIVTGVAVLTLVAWMFVVQKPDALLRDIPEVATATVVMATLEAAPVVSAAPAEPVSPSTDALPPVDTGATRVREPVPVEVIAVAAPQQPVPARRAAAASDTPAAVVMEKKTRQVTPAEQADTLFEAAIALQSSGQASAAEKKFTQVLAVMPRHIEARLTLVQQRLGAGQHAAARTLLDEGLALMPGQGDLSLLLARLHVEQGELDAAVGRLTQHVETNPGDPGGMAFLAAVEQRRQHHTQAVALYRRALALQRQRSEWWAGMAISLEANGKRSEAVTAYRRALFLGGLSPALHNYVTQHSHALQPVARAESLNN